MKGLLKLTLRAASALGLRRLKGWATYQLMRLP